MDTHTDQCDCGSCDDCVDMGVRIGHPVPDVTFKVYDPIQKKDRETKISDFRGKWLVMFFYPADFTFVCPTELGDMADHYDDFVKEGAEIVSASTDTVFAHKVWCDTSETIKKIRFPMAGDTTKELADTFGVLMDDGLALRGSFIINPDGVLRVAHVHDTGIGRNATELLRVLRAAKFVYEHGDKVCPANWQPGAETLTPSMDLVDKI